MALNPNQGCWPLQTAVLPKAVFRTDEEFKKGTHRDRRREYVAVAKQTTGTAPGAVVPTGLFTGARGGTLSQRAYVTRWRRVRVTCSASEWALQDVQARAA